MTDSVVFIRNLEAAASHRYRLIANKGGTRSGKTYSIMRLVLLYACQSSIRVSVVSESIPHLKKGVLRDFEDILERLNVRGVNVNKTDRLYRFPSGGYVEFFSVDDWGKVKGSSRDVLFINEANRMGYEAYRQLVARTTSQVFIDWNPDSEFWYEERGLDRLPTTCEIHSTYKDNPYLSAVQVAEIERNRNDSQWWRVYGEGLTGSHEGLVYRNMELIDDVPERVTGGHVLHTFGLDFGFSNDPTALVEVWTDEADGVIYLDEKIYDTGLLNRDIANEMARLGISKTTEIFADAAEPKSIEELHRVYRYNVKEAYKRDLLSQVQFMQSFNFRITKRSVNVIKEWRNYKWKTDREGKNVNEPCDMWNHAADAVRYAVFTPLRGKVKAKVVGSNLYRLPPEI